MKQILISAVLSALAVLLIPTRTSIADSQSKEAAQIAQVNVQAAFEPPESETESESKIKTETEVSDKTCTLRLLNGDTVTTVDEQSYLCGVLLCEMPISFDEQALCAQCVAARTFLRRQMQAGKHENADVCADSACCQAWADEAALKARFGDSYSEANEKALRAVTATQDEVLTYNGALIDATYFSCSGGQTEEALAVWGTDVPYLRSVKSYGEESAPRYHSVVSLTPDELREKLENASLPLTLIGAPEDWLGEISYTAGGGVDTLVIGQTAYRGTQLRTLLGLNSTQFSPAYVDGEFVFDVYGFGHRVGMSQYGAEYMAQQGWSYRRILEYYYSGATLAREVLP